MIAKWTTLQERISANYEGLSDQLRIAADYVAANPFEIATRSLRSVAADTSLKPATLSRLARALQFSSYEEMRELCRNEVSKRSTMFSDAATQLQKELGEGPQTQAFLKRQSASAVHNIEMMMDQVSQEQLEQAVDILAAAKRVILVGALSSQGPIDYFGYLVSLFAPNWISVSHTGTLGSALADTGPDDVVVIMTLGHYVQSSITAAEVVASRNAKSILFTDAVSCPALKYATMGFIIPTESPHFFSSYVSAVLLMETLAGMLLARLGSSARDRIATIEKNNFKLGTYWRI